MGKCVKCNAELIGSGKFCAACGAPVPEALRGPEPPSVVTISGTPPPGPAPGSSSQMGQTAGQPNPSQVSVSPVPQSSGYEPPSHVNPFAATASPSSPVSRVRTDALAVGPISAGSAVISMSPHASTPPDPLASTAKPDPVKPESSRVDSVAAAPSAVIPSSAAVSSASGPPSVPNALGQTMDAKQLEAQFGSQPPPAPAVPASRSPSRPPTPREGDPSQVSPLAVSNAISQRGAFQQAMESAREKASSVSPPAPPAQPNQPAQPATPAARPNKKPGTQIMANAPNRPPPAAAKPAEEKPAPAKAAPQRTVAMGFNAAAIMAKAQAAQQQAPGSVVSPTPSAPSAASAHIPPSVAAAASQPGMPPSVVQPTPGAPFSVGQPSSSHAQPPTAQPASQMPHPGMHGGGVGAPHAYPGAAAQPGQPAYPNAAPAPHAAQPQPPAGPGGWGWSAPQQPPGYGYGFGYAPGSRVHVTWSNGQRYPATVSQVSGSQCLVVFPDGQQHWVEMQYLSPG